jgi:hypothetical protein
MEFGTATWRYATARRGKTTIVLSGNDSDIKKLSQWFEDNNVVERCETRGEQLIMYFSKSPIVCPEELVCDLYEFDSD